jgi:hypothetical protein
MWAGLPTFRKYKPPPYFLLTLTLKMESLYQRNVANCPKEQVGLAVFGKC